MYNFGLNDHHHYTLRTGEQPAIQFIPVKVCVKKSFPFHTNHLLPCIFF